MVWNLWWYSLLLLSSDVSARTPRSSNKIRQPRLLSPTSSLQSPRSPPGPKPLFHNPKPVDDFQKRPARQKSRRGGWRCTLWPGAAVIYSIHPNIGCPSSEVCGILIKAIKHYEEYTCIRFKARSGEEDYVMISWDQNKDSESMVGRDGGEQPLTLGPQCLRYPIDVIHEFGHVLGLPDEVTRPDRDAYVRIDFEAIKEVDRPSFEIEYPAFPLVLKEQFDYESVMMYSAFSAAKDGIAQTIYTTRNDQHLVPRSSLTGLSDGDIRKISRLYKCQETKQDPSFPFDVTCSFDKDTCGFKNLNDAKWFHEKSDPSGRIEGGFMFVDYETSAFRPQRLLSVNFHGLSPIDNKRGPMGCVMFSYFISTDGPATLNLTVTELDSPHQRADVRRSLPLWSQSNAVTQWDVVKTPVNVQRPFMVMFGAQFKPGTKDGIIGLGDFVLTYTPCDEPTPPPSTPTPNQVESSKKKISRRLGDSFRASFHKAGKFKQLAENKLFRLYEEYGTDLK